MLSLRKRKKRIKIKIRKKTRIRMAKKTRTAKRTKTGRIKTKKKRTARRMRKRMKRKNRLLGNVEFRILYIDTNVKDYPQFVCQKNLRYPTLNTSKLKAEHPL